jgi:RNA recognition motif-containing protein
MVKRDGYNNQGSDRQEQGRRKRSRPSYAANNNSSVHVGNLDYKTKWQDLKDHMRKAGNVDHVSFDMEMAN